MKQRKPFWLYKRSTAYYVEYRIRPGKLLSAHTLDKKQAEIWAIEHLDDNPLKKLITFKEFTKDFYIPGECQWLKRRMKKGSIPGVTHLKNCRAIIENHLLPALGDYILSAIKIRQLDDWLLDSPLSGQTKNHILSVLRTIFQEAEDQELIERNPADKIKPFNNDWVKRDIFREDEFSLLFPQDHEKLLEIWGGQMWTAFFMVMSVGGLRPGEVLAFAWRDWYRSLHGMIASRSIDNEGEVKNSLKSGEMKPVLLTERAEHELLLWENKSKYTDRDDFIFCRIKDKPMVKIGVGRRFHKAVERAAINVAGRNLVPYSLRHGFNTDMLKRAPMEAVQILMGHRTERMTRHYDHPEPEDLLKGVQSLRSILENRWKS